MKLYCRIHKAAPLLLSLFLSICLSSFSANSLASSKVLLETNMGSIKIELFDEKAPVTVANFLNYVDKKHYDNVIFHRVIAGFMIQTGGFDVDMVEKNSGDAIENESKTNRLHNERGTLAMARTSDPHSATAQFFINVRLNLNLDYRMGQYGYAVFGKVIEGMDIVDTISLQKTGTQRGFQDVPIEAITIIKASRITE